MSERSELVGEPKSDSPIREIEKQSDPEYLLKGVQAFGVGAALFAASLAVAHTTLAQAEMDRPFPLTAIMVLALFLVNLVISTFGSIGVMLGLSMTGMVKVKQPVKIFDWEILGTWVTLVFALASAL
ncbi:MAG: hypothetical protein MUF73_19615 [Rhodobacteraceae bacterium]|jgi:type III secretory pathway component EscR|nr:hypothetical protein [Paracoccaceae bacterium]